MNSTIMTLFDQMMIFVSGEGIKSILGRNLQEFLTAAYRMVLTIQGQIVQPFGLTLLSVFILLEFQKISLKVENSGGGHTLGFEMIVKALTKFALSYIFIMNIQKILDAIVLVASDLTNKVLYLGDPSNEISAVASMRRIVNNAVDDMSWWTSLIVLLVFAMFLLAALVVQTYIRLTVYLRFLELYIYCAIAPIPVGAAPSQEFSSMTKNFIKNFAAISLQSVMISLVLVLYPTIFLGIIEETGTGIWSVLLGILVYLLALIFSIQKTSSWAKMIFQAQ